MKKQPVIVNPQNTAAIVLISTFVTSKTLFEESTFLCFCWTSGLTICHGIWWKTLSILLLWHGLSFAHCFSCIRFFFRGGGVRVCWRTSAFVFEKRFLFLEVPSKSSFSIVVHDIVCLWNTTLFASSIFCETSVLSWKNKKIGFAWEIIFFFCETVRGSGLSVYAVLVPKRPLLRRRLFCGWWVYRRPDPLFFVKRCFLFFFFSFFSFFFFSFPFCNRQAFDFVFLSRFFSCICSSLYVRKQSCRVFKKYCATVCTFSFLFLVVRTSASLPGFRFCLWNDFFLYFFLFVRTQASLPGFRFFFVKRFFILFFPFCISKVKANLPGFRFFFL